MANISSIKLPSGTTYDISATKLKTPRTIGIGTGATGTATSFDGTSNITIPITDVKGNYITRPTYITAGSINAFDFPIVDLVSAPRSAFLPGTQITVEYSTNGGATWVDYGLTTANKAKLCNLQNNGDVKLGGPSAGTVTTNFRARITLYADANCTYSQTTSERYAKINMAYIYLSTSGHTLSCEISGSKRNALTTFSTLVSERPVSGWGGPNMASFGAITWGGGATQSTQYGAIRFTFAVTAVGSNTTSKPQITGLRLYGDTGWVVSNNMMKSGHMYNWDDSQNVTFPAKVTATSFTGSAALTGTPTAPTASAGTNNTQIATTAFVKTAIDNAGGGGNTLVFTNKTVAASAWSSNSDLDYYGYRASIPLTGVTASMMPQVTFTDSQLAEYDLAPICQSYAGGVYIYSAEAISEAITIPSIGLIGG
jgi:hypothetical protein